MRFFSACSYRAHRHKLQRVVGEGRILEVAELGHARLEEPTCGIFFEVNESQNQWLSTFLAARHGVSGTVHVHQDEGLKLTAAVNIPEKVQQIVAWVPNGKGMAGLALERGTPIQTCNLKEDASGAVKPGAKAVDAKGAVAIPVKAADGGVRAVVGIAFADERQFSESDLHALTEEVKSLPDV